MQTLRAESSLDWGPGSEAQRREGDCPLGGAPEPSLISSDAPGPGARASTQLVLSSGRLALQPPPSLLLPFLGPCPTRLSLLRVPDCLCQCWPPARSPSS